MTTLNTIELTIDSKIIDYVSGSQITFGEFLENIKNNPQKVFDVQLSEESFFFSDGARGCEAGSVEGDITNYEPLYYLVAILQGDVYTQEIWGNKLTTEQMTWVHKMLDGTDGPSGITASVITGRNNWNVNTIQKNLPQLLEVFKKELKARGKTYLPSSEVLKLVGTEVPVDTKEDPTERPVRTVKVYTDGSCNVHSDHREGGWGVYLECGEHTKELSGSELNTTNNKMELRAMAEALSAVDISKEGFVFEFVTDSKYVINAMVRKNHYETIGFKKVKNAEEILSLYAVMDEKGIEVSLNPDVGSRDNWKSGDIVLSSDTISFILVKGHSDCEGNNIADKLANKARKEIVKTEVVDSTEGKKMVTKEMIENAKTFDDIDHIISLSSELEFGNTSFEDFTSYTAVKFKGESVFEIMIPEKVSSIEYCIKKAAEHLVEYLKEEGIYDDSDSSADSVEEEFVLTPPSEESAEELLVEELTVYLDEGVSQAIRHACMDLMKDNLEGGNDFTAQLYTGNYTVYEKEFWLMKTYKVLEGNYVENYVDNFRTGDVTKELIRDNYKNTPAIETARAFLATLGLVSEEVALGWSMGLNLPSYDAESKDGLKPVECFGFGLVF